MRAEHTLYIVATPIGHRGDLSARAIETLRAVDRVYAEDTRRSLPLLRHHGIATPVHALHEHNEARAAERVVAHVAERGSVALVSDAGTPLISDPGFRVVRAALAAGLRVSPVPGPSAVSAALAVAGLPTDRFQFVGFPPARASARRRWLAALAAVPHTLVLFESPHRIVDALADLAAAFGGARETTLARELTKRHETLLHGSVAEVLERVREDPDQRRGEIVLVVAGRAWRGDAAPATAVSGAVPGAGDVDGPQEERSAEVGADDDRGGANAGPGVRADAEAEEPPVPAPTEAPALALDRVVEVLLAQKLPPATVARCAAALCGVPRRVAYRRVLGSDRPGSGRSRSDPPAES